jgi:hypothetical protein
MASVAAAASGTADLLSSPQQGVRHSDRARLARIGEWSRLRQSSEVEKEFLDAYDVHQAGGRTLLEYWIPASEVPALNAHNVGSIEIVHAFP